MTLKEITQLLDLTYEAKNDTTINITNDEDKAFKTIIKTLEAKYQRLRSN